MAKNKITPSGKEIIMRPDDFIVSKTNPKGIITYGNQIFIEYSGYDYSELLGQAHNIIRHPDMPKSVFDLMWRHLQEGKEFFGYVKNLSKNGSHYWTFANVTPSYDEKSKLLGYFSVRRKPRQEAVNTMDSIYKELLATETKVGGKAGMKEASTQLENMLNKKGVAYEDFVLSL